MRIATTKVCKVCGDKYYAKDLCKLHYARMQHSRKIDMPKKTVNYARTINGVCYVQCFDCHHFVKGEFQVDEQDAETVMKHKWFIMSTGYAATTIDNQTVLLHRFLTKCPENLVVDHINHNRLDNRRANLRICTQQENTKNRAVIAKGYSRCNEGGKIRYRVIIESKYYGIYKTEQEAIDRVAEIRRNYL